MFRFLLLNLIPVVAIGVFVLVGLSEEATSILFICSAAVLLLILCFHSGALCEVTYRACSFESDFDKAYLKGLKEEFGSSLLAFFVHSVVILMVVYSLKGFLNGTFAFSISSFALLWVAIIIEGAMQYYFSITKYIDNLTPSEALKKSFLLLIDNPGVSVYLFLNTLLQIVLTVVLFLILPGMSGISCARMKMTRYLMKKYEGMSWEEVKESEEEITGERKFLDFILPLRKKEEK